MKERLLAVMSQIVDLPPGSEGRKQALLSDRQDLEVKRKALEAAISSNGGAAAAASPFSSPAAASASPQPQQPWANSAAAVHGVSGASCMPGQQPPGMHSSGAFRDITNSGSHAATGSGTLLPGNAAFAAPNNSSVGFPASSMPFDGSGSLPLPDVSLRSAAAGVSLEPSDCRCTCRLSSFLAESLTSDSACFVSFMLAECS